MRLACRARSMSNTPHVKGSSKERRSAILTAPSTMEARRISIPPRSRASGGADSSLNWFSAIGSPVQDGLGRLHNFTDIGQRQLLEIGRVWHGHVLACDAGHRGVEIVEGGFHDPHPDLGRDAG